MSGQGPSRRGVLGGAAIGLAASAAPAFGQTAASGGAAPRNDPRSKYPAGPFPEQRQPWPGLQSKMNPRPDCGETSYKGSGRLAGRKALLTGGDSGIGRAAAIAFAREGADVAINYHPDEEPDAREVVALIREAGRKAVALPADIRSRAACEKLVSDAVRQLGGLDILVNNAAYQQSKADISEISDEQMVRTFETNIFAPFRISKAAIPHLPPGSVIINTGSVNSYDPGEELLDYASTKGSILIFTKGLAKQLAKKGIRVNMVAPGPIWTPLQVAGGQLPGKLGEFGKDTPLGRPGQPAELAPLYVMLASDEASFTTGGAVGANGGKGNP
jgi:NAD(P)-dependent dehydrogenase (short-subunit alcohol dehydrogenase family)